MHQSGAKDDLGLRRSVKKTSPGGDPGDREWLRSSGFPNVKDRGRLPGDAIEALRNRYSVVQSQV